MFCNAELSTLTLCIEGTNKTQHGEDFFHSKILSKYGLDKMRHLLKTKILG